jgi:hypothetical protein
MLSLAYKPFTLSAIMLNVIMLSVVLLSVVAQWFSLSPEAVFSVMCDPSTKEL